MSARAIRSLAVLGGGITGLSAACAFARALPQLEITVVEATPDPAALADHLPGTTTSVHRFHAAIGLDEQALIRAGAAVPRLALRFDNWPASAPPWYHVHGEHGVAAGPVAFHQLWSRARREGRAEPYHCYAAAAVLAGAGKFVHPQGATRAPFATFDYALRLHPERYREMLAGLADALSVRRVSGDFAGVERSDDGAVAALLMQGGRRLAADLYIDASGPAAPLAGVMSSPFEAWGACLPCDRVTLEKIDRLTVEPSDTILRRASDWTWTAPLPGTTFTGIVGRSDDPSVPADAIPIRPGRRRAPWIGNVLAVGDAAVALDPLHWPNLHLAQSGIQRAIELLPGRDCHPAETAEYNRRAREEAERMRDFQVLHYLCAAESHEQLELPESLAHTLKQFTRRGLLPGYDEDGLASEIWLSALLGLGLLPQHVTPRAAQVDAGRAASRIEAIRMQPAPLADSLPAFPDYLARLGAPGL